MSDSEDVLQTSLVSDEGGEDTTSGGDTPTPQAGKTDSDVPESSTRHEESYVVRTGGGASENVTRHDCEDELEAWTESLDDACYGYRHLYAESESTLSGTEVSVRLDGFARGFTTPMHHPSAPLAHAVSWKVRALSYPYFEDPSLGCLTPARAAPTENVRVFVADRVWEADGTASPETAAEVLERLHDLDGRDATTADRRLLERWEASKDACTRVRGAESGIENTVRAAFDLSQKYESTAPNPDTRYADCTLDELQRKLGVARNARDAVAERRDTLRDQLDADRQEWFESTVREQFPEVAGDILDTEDTDD